jgi:predicted RNA binding protein YcfA (HicA-like mRNA interferase family)
LKKAGWWLNHIEGSHYILVKDGSDVHLSVPVHKGKDLGIGLLKKLIARAGLTNDEYIELFYRK